MCLYSFSAEHKWDKVVCRIDEEMEEARFALFKMQIFF